jgi:hypothetical protein
VYIVGEAPAGLLDPREIAKLFARCCSAAFSAIRNVHIRASFASK